MLLYVTREEANAEADRRNIGESGGKKLWYTTRVESGHWSCVWKWRNRNGG